MKSDQIIRPPESRCLKSGRVILAPGEEIGEHVTENKEELIVILKGKARIEQEGRSIELQEGQAHFIPQGKRHNVRNDSAEELEYVYVVSLFNGHSGQDI